MSFVSIEYNEGKSTDLGYKSVDLHLSDEKLKFDSGDFVKDWYDAMKYLVVNEINEILLFSSSIDHFIMDGAPYEIRRLVYDENKDSYDLFPETIENQDDVLIFINSNEEITWEQFKLKYDDIRKD